jgi:hypothetical protein
MPDKVRLSKKGLSENAASSRTKYRTVLYGMVVFLSDKRPD